MSAVTFQTAYGTAEVRLSVVREDFLAASVPVEQPVLNRAELAADFWREVIAEAQQAADELSA